MTTISSGAGLPALIAAFATGAALTLGSAAHAAPVMVTLDFGTVVGPKSSPYVEKGFEVAGQGLFLSGFGKPTASVSLD